jgi:hypothetical protein
VVDRISITTSRIICRDASGNTTFDSNDSYMRTDSNGQFLAGGLLEVPVIVGKGTASNIGLLDNAGGYLETNESGAYNISNGLFSAASQLYPTPYVGNSALPRAYNYNQSTSSGSTDQTFSFSLDQGASQFKNRFAFSTQNTYSPWGGQNVYLLQRVFGNFIPRDSSNNIPTVNLKQGSTTVGQVYFIVDVYQTFFPVYNSASFVMDPIALPQYVSGDLTAGGTYTCDFYSNPNSYNWRDSGNLNGNSHIHSSDIFWGQRVTYRMSASNNLALVKTA